MSVLDVLVRPRTGVANGRPAGSDLRLVPRTRTRPPRVPFVLLVLVLLGVGLVGLLLVNTQLQQGSFVLHELERNLSDLRDREAALEREVATLKAPQTLATRASALGMVPNPSPGYLVVSGGGDAGVSGNPEPAPSPPPPRPEPPGNQPPENPPAGGADARSGERAEEGTQNGRAQDEQSQDEQPQDEEGRAEQGSPANDGAPDGANAGRAGEQRENGTSEPASEELGTDDAVPGGTATGGEQ